MMRVAGLAVDGVLPVTALRCHTTCKLSRRLSRRRDIHPTTPRARRGAATGSFVRFFFRGGRCTGHSCAHTHTDTHAIISRENKIHPLAIQKQVSHAPRRVAQSARRATTSARSLLDEQTSWETRADENGAPDERHSPAHTVCAPHTHARPLSLIHKPSASSLSDTCTCGRTQVRLRRKPAARSRVHTILWTLMLIAHWPTCWLCTKPRPGGRHEELTDAFISASEVPFSHPARGFLGHHSLQFLQIGDEIAAASPARNEHFLLAKRAAIHAQLVEGHRVVLLGRIEG